LEPCNHFGKQPPCRELLAQIRPKQVIYLEADRNPIASGGARDLNRSGVSTILASAFFSDLNPSEARRLIAIQKRNRQALTPFFFRTENQKPWIVVKEVLDQNGSMIPPPGKKTFASINGLRFAHALRKKTDAILTTTRTVNLDEPLFNLRRVPEFEDGLPLKPLVVVGTDSIPLDWALRQFRLGFDVIKVKRISQAMRILSRRKVLSVLVEAGPTFLESISQIGLWNEWIRILPEDRYQVAVSSE
jgi:diaminohydroxyphosphoribosylaminopyrimidine deaminase/5-amino-6-(5-phosphoribosylamino)uracil reductase